MRSLGLPHWANDIMSDPLSSVEDYEKIDRSDLVTLLKNNLFGEHINTLTREYFFALLNVATQQNNCRFEGGHSAAALSSLSRQQ